MSFSKTVTASYHFLEASSDDYFSKLEKKFSEILANNESAGSFETTKEKYLWKLNDKIDIKGSSAYFISLAKEKNYLPVLVNEKGGIEEISVNDGIVGELSYALISPKYKFLVSTSAPEFKKLLNEFSLDMGVRMTPLFIDKVDELIMNWGFYKKLGITLTFPLHDDLTEFMTTKIGSTISIVDKLEGLKIDITVSNPKAKHQLNAYEVREVISSLIENEMCGKIKVSGGEFDDEVLQNIDIKKAVVKYSEIVVINGSYLKLDDAKGLLIRAYNEHWKALIE